MTNKKIYLSSPHMSEEGFEKEFVNEAFDTNWIAPLGENVDKLEKEFQSMLGAKASAVLNTGTAALHMSLKAANVKALDIVFCQALTFAATANAILYQNAIPVFIDSDRETWNMDKEQLKKAFIKYTKMNKKPKAVIVVHLYGLSSDMEDIKRICDEYEVPLIEDAAESLGTTYKNKYTGTIGDFGVFSFNGNKIITASGGGIVVSSNEERINKIKFWSTQSKENQRYYEHNEVGYNYRMSNVLAGIARGQLKVLHKRIQKKKYIFDYYKKELEGYAGIEMMPVNSWNNPNYWLTCILLKKDVRPIEIIECLEKDNIESRHIWKPMQLQPIFKQYDFIGEGISADIFNSGVCLPSDTKMEDTDIERVINSVKNACK